MDPTYRTHPDYLAHLAGVRANPDDDLPRLVLADWLDEGGWHERAELIRWMCLHPAARVTFSAHPLGVKVPVVWGWPRADGEPVLQWVNRIGEHFREHPAWASDTSLTVSRGFWTAVQSPFAAWCEHAADILPESVGLTVRLTDRPEVLTRFGDGSGDWLGECCLLEGDDVWLRAPHSSAVADLLRLRWPDVTAWELPPEPYTQDWFARWGVTVEAEYTPDPAARDRLNAALLPRHGAPPG